MSMLICFSPTKNVPPPPQIRKMSWHQSWGLFALCESDWCMTSRFTCISRQHCLLITTVVTNQNYNLSQCPMTLSIKSQCFGGKSCIVSIQKCWTHDVSGRINPRIVPSVVRHHKDDRPLTSGQGLACVFEYFMRPLYTRTCTEMYLFFCVFFFQSSFFTCCNCSPSGESGISIQIKLGLRDHSLTGHITIVMCPVLKQVG